MKNLDKRIISAITAFGLAVCSMNADVFNFSNVKAKTEVVWSVVTDTTNENVSLPRTRKGTYNIDAYDEFTATNGILRILYNENKLSFRDIRMSDSLKNAFTYTKTDVPGTIVIGFASDKPISFKENILSIDFDFAPGQISNIVSSYCLVKVEELETEDADGVIQDISANGFGLIKGSELRPSIGISYSSNNYAFANIGLFTHDNCGFTNGVFSFEYDPEFLEFTEANGGIKFTESMVDSYVVKPGLVKCAVVSDKTISEDGNFLNLKFKVLKDGTADIKGTVIEFNNVVSENDIAEYTPSIPPITINVNSTAIAPPPEVSKIPAVPYTQPYATPKPPSPPYTEPAVTSVSVNETEITTEVESVTSEAAVTIAEVNPEPTEQPTETAPVSTEPAVQPTETAPVSTEPAEQPTETAPVSTEPTEQPTETAPVSTEPTEQPTETAPASPEPTVQPIETTPASSEPTVQPTETTPASSVPTEQPTETTPASPVPTVTPTLTPPSLTPPTAKPAEPTEAESFDVNDDGAVNTRDLLSLIRMIIDDHAAKKVTADLNGDGHINAEDIIIMKKHLAQ